MLIKRRAGWEMPESQATPEAVFLDRRQWLAGGLGAIAGAALPQLAAAEGADPTLDLYAKATTATITSALARATSQKQRFPSFDDLATSAKAGKLKIDERDWLPAALINDSFAVASTLRKRGMLFAMTPASGGTPPKIVCTLNNGKKLTGRFRISGGRVAEVIVD